MYKNTALDIMTKGTNLCRFLCDEKGEKLLSSKLFDSVASLSQSCYSLSNPSLSKNELASFRKTASFEWYNVNFYLDSLYMSGYISSAQKDSMTSSLENAKKEINL